jgi:GNAT superfamily N-acetyltransferase
MRGQGIGTRIMRSVENEAARRGCRGVWLDTASYQAPAFYQKLGFTPFARIDDYITGHDRFWFRKTPIGGGQDQGLAIVDEPDEASRRGVSETLSAYNTARVGPGGWRHVAVVLREDEESPSLGGLWGRFGRDWLFIELLGLPEARRGQGIGRRIMADAEAAARQAGCRGIWLDTFSFQARPFYERLGYTCLGEIPDYPPPHSRFLLARRLDGAPLLRDTASAQPRNPR